MLFPSFVGVVSSCCFHVSVCISSLYGGLLLVGFSRTHVWNCRIFLDHLICIYILSSYLYSLTITIIYIAPIGIKIVLVLLFI